MAIAERTDAARSTTLPVRAGVGLKLDHAAAILEADADIGFFEVHPENFMGDGGPPHRYLTSIRERYPLSLHGVGLSIGSDAPLDPDHLARLKALVDRYEPQSFSEHLAWSSHDVGYLNDLLPLPYTQATLAIVAAHVAEVQDHLKRPILVENPSTYVTFAGSDMPEVDFLSELARRTGCGLLLDINNVFVSATNHGFDPAAYLASFPIGRVGEVHLAGHASDSDESGAPLLIDSHDRAVQDPVWALYAQTMQAAGGMPTLVEWDSDLPDWPVLAAEAAHADAILAEAASGIRYRAAS